MSEGSVTLGIDVGTSSVKVVAVDDSGTQIASAERPHALMTPRPGWTEQQPEDWWQGACEALAEIRDRLAGASPEAIGLSGQMHGMVPLDAHDAVIRPAILWNDQRTGEAAREIDRVVGRERLLERGGNPAITGFQLAKVVWLRSAEPERFARLTHAAAAASGLPDGLPVVAGAGDNAAAATGMGLSSAEPELGSVSLGTSGVLFAPIARATPDPQGRVHLFCHADGGYYLLGVTLAAAGSLQWAHDALFEDVGFDELTRLAEASPPGAGGVTFQPYLSGERTPYMDPALRGAWRGLTLATQRADLVRSVLEGVAFSQRDSLEVMRPLANLERVLATGGGSRSRFWLQLLADALELPITQLRDAPGAAYGAALLAHRALGRTVAPDLAPLARLDPAPDEALREAYARYRAWSPAPL
ncbi:MAG: FGGY family carbohydrate kinase [Deinococcales bacterium]